MNFYKWFNFKTVIHQVFVKNPLINVSRMFIIICNRISRTCRPDDSLETRQDLSWLSILASRPGAQYGNLEAIILSRKTNFVLNICSYVVWGRSIIVDDNSDWVLSLCRFFPSCLLFFYLLLLHCMSQYSRSDTQVGE